MARRSRRESEPATASRRQRGETSDSEKSDGVWKEDRSRFGNGKEPCTKFEREN